MKRARSDRLSRLANRNMWLHLFDALAMRNSFWLIPSFSEFNWMMTSRNFLANILPLYFRRWLDLRCWIRLEQESIVLSLRLAACSISLIWSFCLCWSWSWVILWKILRTQPTIDLFKIRLEHRILRFLIWKLSYSFLTLFLRLENRLRPSTFLLLTRPSLLISWS